MAWLFAPPAPCARVRHKRVRFAMDDVQRSTRNPSTRTVSTSSPSSALLRSRDRRRGSDLENYALDGREAITHTVASSRRR